MEERVGVWGQERVWYPIGTSDIRRWAIAVYWPETPLKIFWDEDYATATRWGGIIAPQNFTPFACPVHRAAPAAAAAARPSREAQRFRVMNGGQTDTYGVPMRPGDVVTARSRLQRYEERATPLGGTLFTFTENEWRNQHGEVVKQRISTGIRYLPA